MRAFIAITLPKETKAALAAAVKRLAPSAVDVAWCAEARMHLTLAFLGEIAPSILPHLSTALTRVCQALPPVPCHAYGFGFFGNRRNPKIIWAGVDPTPGLDALHAALWHELKRFGFETDEDRFRPHVTLGRCKERARNQPLTDAMDADTEIDFGRWTAPDVTLFESRPSPKGSLYLKLNAFRLGGGKDTP
ncbi:MAG: RNA 2',3'-cyclic phosphodiesterase [Kiritimatiellaeota bacterium]|nr:RNA 2',3'-cyclic phosphodiesterase [Kiritimatiellota bacterium]